MGVSGLGDGALHSRGAGGVFGGDQADEGADAVTGKAVPVADLHREREPGQRRDSAQTSRRTTGVNSLGGHVISSSGAPRSRRDDRRAVLAGVKAKPLRVAYGQP